MSNNTFNFELVSPEQKLISEQAFQVTIPGEGGDVGVRAGHMALLMSVRSGVVEIIRSEGGSTEKIFIAGGFADVSQTNCTVLAEQAVPVASLQADKLEAEITKLNEDLTLSDTSDEKAKISERLALVHSMLDAVKAT